MVDAGVADTVAADAVERESMKNMTAIYSTLLTSLLAGALLQAGTKDSQKSFATAEEAVHATIDAAEHNDTAALLHIFGPDGKDIVESGDPAEDKDLRTEFARSAHQKLELDTDPLQPDRVTFSVGEQSWPFPVPLVRRDGKWMFDSGTGKYEILARRIGANELHAMEVCRGYAEAQMEFASAERDGDPVLKYAQTVSSTSGKQDGLYVDGPSESLVSKGFADAASNRAVPYHGYYFRVLKSQGPDAPGGAFDYVVQGKMIGGFALVAMPADYGVSGILTFIINQDGLVYEKDLGATTATQARQMTKFNPEKSWRAVVLE